MATAIHFKSFLGAGTLCGILRPKAEELTSRPEHVTCEKCLTMMGRRLEDLERSAEAG